MNALAWGAIKAQDTATPPGFTWSREARRYRNAQNGRFVAYRNIYGLLDANEEANLHVLRSLTEALYNGELPVPTWYLSAQHQLRRLHVQCAALGAGGFENLRPADFIRIDRKLREEMDRLIIFGEQIRAGLLSEAQISHRLTMYAGTARIQFYRAQSKPLTQPDEVVIERRRLGIADHCEWCLYLVDLGWQPYGVLPYPGETHPSWTEESCLSACHCRMEQKVIKAAELAKWVTSKQVPLWLAGKKSFFAPYYSIWNNGKAWDKDKHQRHPAGTPVDPATGAGGGRFAPKRLAQVRSLYGEPAGKLVADAVLRWRAGEAGANEVLDALSVDASGHIHPWARLDADTLAAVLLEATGGDFRRFAALNMRWGNPWELPAALHEKIAGIFGEIDATDLAFFWGKNYADGITPYLDKVKDFDAFLANYPIEDDYDFYLSLAAELERNGDRRVEVVQSLIDKEDTDTDLLVAAAMEAAQSVPVADDPLPAPEADEEDEAPDIPDALDAPAISEDEAGLLESINQKGRFMLSPRYTSYSDADGHVLNEDGEQIGLYGLKINRARSDIHVNLLSLTHRAQGQGVAFDVLDGIVEYAKANGIETVSLLADITIGRYSWAKYGFGYDPEYGDYAREVTERFPEWAERYGIEKPKAGWPTFQTPQDVISYNIPRVRLTGAQIDNRDIASEDRMKVGKAYMLDYYGHGDWEGIVTVDALERRLKAIRAKRAKR